MDEEMRSVELSRTDALALLWAWHIGEGLEAGLPLDNCADDDPSDEGWTPARRALAAAQQKLATAFDIAVPN